MCSCVESFPAQLTVIFDFCDINLSVLLKVVFCRILFITDVTGKPPNFLVVFPTLLSDLRTLENRGTPLYVIQSEPFVNLK